MKAEPPRPGRAFPCLRSIVVCGGPREIFGSVCCFTVTGDQQGGRNPRLYQEQHKPRENRCEVLFQSGSASLSLPVVKLRHQYAQQPSDHPASRGTGRPASPVSLGTWRLLASRCVSHTSMCFLCKARRSRHPQSPLLSFVYLHSSRKPPCCARTARRQQQGEAADASHTALPCGALKAGENLRGFV